MDEEDIKSLEINNIPDNNLDPDKFLNDLLTPDNHDVNSFSIFDDGSKAESDFKTCKDLLKVSESLGNENSGQFLPETGSNNLKNDPKNIEERDDCTGPENLSIAERNNDGTVLVYPKIGTTIDRLKEDLSSVEDVQFVRESETGEIFNERDPLASYLCEEGEFNSRRNAESEKIEQPIGVENEYRCTDEKKFDKTEEDDVDVKIKRVFNVNLGQSTSNDYKTPCDMDEKETVFDNDAPIENEILLEKGNFRSGEESLKFDSKNIESCSNYSNRSNSIKPSLADDAKLVKFNVSKKSMNIMQSNAQFLNKSRNFLNFITEKSTNIMEKTLLPQNLAARYNSILRLTENNPASLKRLTDSSGENTDSLGVDSTLDLARIVENNCETGDKLENNLTVCSKITETNDSDDNKIVDESVLNKAVIEKEFIENDQTLFLKCAINENKTDNEQNSAQIGKEIETVSIYKLSTTSIDEKNDGANDKVEIVNVNDGETLRHSDSDIHENKENSVSLVDDSDSNPSNNGLSAISRENNLESFDEDNLKSKIEGTSDDDMRIEETNLIKENGNIEIMSVCENESNVEILSNIRSNDCGIFDQSNYTKLLRDYRSLKEENTKLTDTVVKLKSDNEKLSAESNSELHALQLEMIEKTIEQLKNDLKQSSNNQDILSKEYNIANKERESMVMKYAISEKQLIDTQRAKEYAERKVNESLREQEILHAKLKQVQGERTRICNILDGKCHELTDAQKEIERLKEELSMREVKLKWTQNKLKTELEGQKENQQKLEKALIRINEMKEECELVRRESNETIKKFQQSEENKVVSLDQQLKEQQARLILERHVTEDKELSRLQLQKEVETLKQRQLTLIEENNTLSLKVQNLEKERLNYENNLSNFKVIADQRQKEIVDLRGKVSQLETLKLQLQHKEQLLSSNKTEVERLRQTNSELQSDMECCRERESHMLDFTQKLTDKNVRLQSEFTSIEAKNEEFELENASLRDKIKELSSKLKSAEINFELEKSKRTEECELLARHVAEQTQLARNLSQKFEDSQGENAVLRRKQQVSIKEMAKELQICKKKLDAFETGSPSNSLDRTSRTGSSSSLSTGETLNGAVSDTSNSGDHVLQPVEPDRQSLIDRIVKLQKIRVKQAEKLDFLEEHARTLVNELQKKSKIIKNYILHENPDAMGSNERDKNKAELARHGGIMASVYNQRVSDDNMTLELSLEINQKLQAVLEDTLLKNITLKDSIDTLGGEIARLTMKNNRK